MIGEKIHKRRKELKMSLRHLAEEIEMTASYLSQIERECVDPSIKSLRKIADALSIPLLYLLAETQPANLLVREEDRKKLRIPSSALEYELLTPDLDRKLEMFIGHIDPKMGNVAFPLRNPPPETDECMLVTSGCLCIELEGTEYELNVGDSLYFKGYQLTKIFAKGTEIAAFIAAITPAIF